MQSDTSAQPDSNTTMTTQTQKKTRLTLIFILASGFEILNFIDIDRVKDNFFIQNYI